MAIPLKSGLLDRKSATDLGNPSGTLWRSLSMLSMTSSPRKKPQRFLALYDHELQVIRNVEVRTQLSFNLNKNLALDSFARVRFIGDAVLTQS